MMNQQAQESDHELLQYAAKAAELEFRWIRDTPRILAEMGWTLWDPLTDDDDAFRLAVRLKLCIDHDFVETGTFTFNGVTEGEYEAGVKVWRIIPKEPNIDIQEVYGGDPLVATRRAIVKAAAEIGRNMV
jgi:hypothetical protein